MSEINLYIYNYVDDSNWEMEVCGRCGQKLMEVKGELVRRVTNEGAPKESFDVRTAFMSTLCRRCHTRNNLYITSFETHEN